MKRIRQTRERDQLLASLRKARSFIARHLQDELNCTTRDPHPSIHSKVDWRAVDPPARPYLREGQKLLWSIDEVLSP